MCLAGSAGTTGTRKTGRSGRRPRFRTRRSCLLARRGRLRRWSDTSSPLTLSACRTLGAARFTRPGGLRCLGTAATTTGGFRGFAGGRACRFRRWSTTCCGSSSPTWSLAAARPARVARGGVRRRSSGTSVRSARRRWPSADRCRRRRGRRLCWDQRPLRRFGRSVRPSQLTSSSSPWRRRVLSRRAASCTGLSSFAAAPVLGLAAMAGSGRFGGAGRGHMG